MKAIITIGLPGSGKSTYVRKIYSGVFEINLDDIRASYCPDYVLDWAVFDFEKHSSKVEADMETLLQEVIDNETSMVISNTNINVPKLATLLKRLCVAGYHITILDFTQLPIETVLKRNSGRPKRLIVKESVILNMYSRIQKPTGPETINSVCALYADTIQYIRS